jgi:branched-chain amino acid transport system substrate-binding protein
MDGSAALTDAMSKKGVKLLVREQHSVGAVDFRTNLIKIRAANPPALLVISNITEVGHIANQIQELGIKSQLFGTTFASSNDNMKIAPEAMKRFRGVMVDFNSTANEKAKKFADAFKKEFGKEANVHAAITYDTVYVLAAAIKAAGYSPEGMRKYLATAKGLNGVMGNLAFDPDRVIMFDVVKWKVEGGKAVESK